MKELNSHKFSLWPTTDHKEGNFPLGTSHGAEHWSSRLTQRQGLAKNVGFHGGWVGAGPTVIELGASRGQLQQAIREA